ncbi:MAG: VOC family protein [Actinobacteria bacterium]|nr:VOC family protein [Actinomycetota bacterium]
MDHVGLSVADLDAAAEFYRRALGFQPELDFELPFDDVRGAMMLHPSGLRLELFERPGAAPGIQGSDPREALATHGYGHFALTATALEPVYEALLSAGAVGVRPPGPSPQARVQMAFVTDPEGNLIELVERGEAG